MKDINVFPDKRISEAGLVSKMFLELGIKDFLEACHYVHNLPYGYNSDRDDLMILFKEKMGTCSTKHAVIATLAAELGSPITRGVGIYPMTEAIVSWAHWILSEYRLPYVPDPLFPGIWKLPC